MKLIISKNGNLSFVSKCLYICSHSATNYFCLNFDWKWLQIYNDLCPKGIYGYIQIGNYWLCFDLDNEELAISLNDSPWVVWEVVIPRKIKN